MFVYHFCDINFLFDIEILLLDKNIGLRQFNGCPCIDPRGPISGPLPNGPGSPLGPGSGSPFGSGPGGPGLGAPNFGGPNPGFSGPNFNGPLPGGGPGAQFPGGPGGPQIPIRPARDLFARLNRAGYAPSKSKK